MAKSPGIGSKAPVFVLDGVLLTDGEVERRSYRLAEANGRPLVLVFYPGDDTPVCTRQLCSYTSDLERFKGLGAQLWGISPQDLDSHERFARKHGLGFPLLADPDRAVARAYGIAVPGLGLRRSVFVLDEDGAVRWKHVALAGLTFQHSDTLAEQLAALKA
ncbi:peroxiredoxin [Kitasatospora sp. NPDC001175]|uniref:peroxiredoxin n=1 Tax=Kitasatospora sp. NPDC001175 TaxID=3157103 RepID=UPI003CFC4634